MESCMGSCMEFFPPDPKKHKPSQGDDRIPDASIDEEYTCIFGCRGVKRRAISERMSFSKKLCPEGCQVINTLVTRKRSIRNFFSAYTPQKKLKTSTSFSDSLPVAGLMLGRLIEALLPCSGDWEMIAKNLGLSESDIHQIRSFGSMIGLSPPMHLIISVGLWVQRNEISSDRLSSAGDSLQQALPDLTADDQIITDTLGRLQNLHV